MINRQSRHYPWVLLGVLFIVYLCASIDRIVISLLVEPIKADLGLTDTQISLLLGLAFVLIFSLASIPMGILVDRVNRTRLLGAGVATWSFMTALCGLAGSFWTLFLSRAGVGISEAIVTPAGYSLISDAFEKRKLGMALGIFTMGGAVGTGLSLLLGGYAVGTLSKHGDFELPVLGLLHPWQLTFVLLAIPGFLIAIIMAAMQNPLRKTRNSTAIDPGVANAIGSFYRQNKALLARHHIAAGLTSFALLGAYSWIAPLFFRVHEWKAADVGYAAGLVSLIGTPLGLLGGGALGDYLLRYGAHMRLWVCAAAMGSAAIFASFYPLLPNANWAMVFFGAMVAFATIPAAVGNAALQHVVPGEIRGRVSAIYGFTLSIISMLGPTLVAATADLFFPFPKGIGYATAVVVTASLVVATGFWIWSIPPYRRLLQELDSQGN